MKKFFMSIILCITFLSATLQLEAIISKPLDFLHHPYSICCDLGLPR